MRRTISILCHDLAGNALGLSVLLAELLEPEYRVHIVGYGAKDKLWSYYRDDRAFQIRRYYHSNTLSFLWGHRRVIRKYIEGDIILAVKPMLVSYGLGLRARRVMGKPLMLHMDDWDQGFLSDSIYWEARLLGVRWLASPTSPLTTRLLDRHIRRADAVTSVSRFLQKQYGGYWIPHARDEAFWDPSCYPAPASEPSAVFLGVMREHKGPDELLAAWAAVRAPNAVLRVIGTPLDWPILHVLRARADHRVRFEGSMPVQKVPAVLASASLVLLPQREGRASVGQLPLKMIDAMAMARPIISTAVSDIPDWLADGAGVVVPPGDVASMAAAIERVLHDPAGATAMGRRARDRFLRFASFAAVRPRMVDIVEALIARRPLPPPTLPFERGGVPEVATPVSA